MASSYATGRFRLDIKKKLFTKRVVKHLKMLSREVFKSPSLEVVNSHIDVALRDRVSGGVGSAGLAAGVDDLKSLFQSK